MRWLLAIFGLILAALVLPPLWYAVFAETPPELPAPGRRVEVRPGLAVNVIEEGSGPPVLLVHGHPACAYDWQPLMGELAARGFRAIAYDRAGYGYSDARPPGPVTVAMNAEELVALIAALELEETTLVGWSYGGGTSIVAMKRDPSRVARLLLVGSVGPGIADRDTVPKAPAWLAEFLAGPVYDWISAVPPLSRRLSNVLMSAAFHPDPVPDWYRTQAAANFGRPHTRDAFRSEGRDLGGEADLDPAPIELPILVLHGSEDRLAPPFVADALHERAAGSELRWIADGSHMLPITHPAVVADTIREFAADPAAGHTFEHDGVSLYYEIHGAGDPLLVVHGNGGSIGDLGPQIDHFRKSYRVIAMDSRDQGRSGDSAGALTYEEMTGDLVALLDHLNVASAHVLGWSDGGVQALLLGIHYPTRVRKLVVIAANLDAGEDAFLPDVSAWLKSYVDAIPVADPSGRRERKVASIMLDQPNIDVKALESIRAPTLVMAGDRDLIRDEHTVEIYHRIPNGQLAIFPNATHLLPFDDPVVFNAVVERFLSDPSAPKDRIDDAVESLGKLRAASH